MPGDGTRTTRMFVIFFALCASLQLCLMPPGAAASTGPTDQAGWITGVVVDGQGNPVAGDLVNALGPREVPEVGIIAEHTDRRTWTDANGRFRVRQADPHGYLVQVCDPEPSDKTTCKETARGVDHLITYVGPAGVTDSWVLQTSLFRTQSTDRDLGTVQVKPQSFVHGRIAHAVNEPIQILRLNGTVAYYNVTDSHGSYRFQGLAPGRYRVQAGGLGTGWLRWISGVVDVGSGQDAVVNGTLDRGADIHGVLRSDGQPVPFTDILVRRQHGPTIAAVTTNENGFYKVSGLTPGTYRLGIMYDGSDYRRHAVTAVVPDAHASVLAKIAVQKGAVVTVSFQAGGKPATGAIDELRDSTGHPILALHNDGSGHATYAGLSPGTYTVVGATETHYAMASVHVTKTRTYDLGTLSLQHPTLTLSGTTAPSAVVEAKTGQECPPDEPVQPGAFQFIERADANGHYQLNGLVPGLYMLGSDGYPGNFVPRCIPDVTIKSSLTKDLPLEVGSTASGRLVYHSTGTPVITTLSYQITYPPGRLNNPTSEHPTRDKTTGAWGNFSIDRLAAGAVTGALSQGADLGQINSPKFFVIFPFQDGTPYYLTSTTRAIDIHRRANVQLGDIPLYLHS